MSRHSRRRFDDDDFTLDQRYLGVADNRFATADNRFATADDLPDSRTLQPTAARDDPDPDEPDWSTYPDAAHGPQPVPRWVIVSPAADDDDLGVLKTGKEAEVSLLRRSLDGRHNLLAVKRYRGADHRLFHRDSGYLEGRSVRRSREMRAMQTRTAFGRDLIAGQWAAAEFAVLSQLWVAGAAVPYPVQLLETELMMEFIGDEHGVAAPRLAQLKPTPAEARGLFEQMRSVLSVLSQAGYTHGDLSPYNVLVDNGRLVLIDLPQAVDLVGNPQALDYLRRDCANICHWFRARGVTADPGELCNHLLDAAPGFDDMHHDT